MHTQGLQTFHPKNFYQGEYDFDALAKAYPNLNSYLRQKSNGKSCIDFSNKDAVYSLNAACMKLYFDTTNWILPDGFLCPGIPGRIDYIHHLSDHFIQKETQVKILDIGTGASAIYSILCASHYQWSVVGSDIETHAIENARSIIEANEKLRNQIEIRHQPKSTSIFNNIIRSNEYYDATVCNPPFYINESTADLANRKKQIQHKKRQIPYSTDHRSFQGKSNELHCEGGEQSFIKTMICESENYSKNVAWFTTLVSRKKSLNILIQELGKHPIQSYRVIPMFHGNKESRILAWKY